jgi:MFS family permease
MVQSFRRIGAATFSSLRIRNYRLYYAGQVISNCGTWMQSIAQAWLVLKLTNSGTALGLITALQSLPVLLFGTWGGVLADRFPKRKLLIITQLIFAILALTLGTLVATGVVRLWMVAVMAMCLGLTNAIDNPTRQSFVVEMVGESRGQGGVASSIAVESVLCDQGQGDLELVGQRAYNGHDHQHVAQHRGGPDVAQPGDNLAARVGQPHGRM